MHQRLLSSNRAVCPPIGPWSVELEPLANAKLPTFHIHGDKNTVVPYEQNAVEPARRYKALRGDIQGLMMKDEGHSHWPDLQGTRRFPPQGCWEARISRRREVCC